VDDCSPKNCRRICRDATPFLLVNIM
jgi:hypothetical protein